MYIIFIYNQGKKLLKVNGLTLKDVENVEAHLSFREDVPEKRNKARMYLCSKYK